MAGERPTVIILKGSSSIEGEFLVEGSIIKAYQQPLAEGDSVAIDLVTYFGPRSKASEMAELQPLTLAMVRVCWSRKYS